jgi:hypothetical protein
LEIIVDSDVQRAYLPFSNTGFQVSGKSIERTGHAEAAIEGDKPSGDPRADGKQQTTAQHDPGQTLFHHRKRVYGFKITAVL